MHTIQNNTAQAGASLMTPTQQQIADLMAQRTASDIEMALATFRERAPFYCLFREYYDGKHRLLFASEKFRSAFGELFRAFSDNLMPIPVDLLNDRLALSGFALEGGTDSTADAAWAIWRQNRMDQRAGEVHREALRSGDSYLIVWPDDDGRATLYPNAAANCMTWYDEEMPGRILWGAKYWIQRDRKMRLTLYYSDRIEKYITRNTTQGMIPEHANAFEPFQVAGEPWPVPNVWGVPPIFHFANNADIGQAGRSELASVIPLQDALNKSVADMLVSSEFHAYPQRWAIGIETAYDEEGKPVAPFKPGVDRLWTVGNEQARFGQFDPTHIDNFLKAQESFRIEIARVSGVPLHYLVQSGDWPSGEALKNAETRLIKKARQRQTAFGNVWENALAFALRIEGRSPDRHLVAQWEDAAPRDEKGMLEAQLLKQQIGVSQKSLLAEMGYSPEQESANRADEQTSLADQLTAGFNRN